MWPFKSKKKPILRVISREYLGRIIEPADYGYGMGTDLDVYDKYAVTYQDVETGETFVTEELSLG
jgi:hypothetical protein